MYKVFALIALFVAVASSAELTATIAASLPWGLEDTVCYYDGIKTLYIMGGWDGINYDHQIRQLKLDSHGNVEDVASFPTGLTEGSLGVDGEGAFFYLGGDKGGKSADIWKMTPANPNPTFMGLLPEASRLSCSVSDLNGNVYKIGGATQSLTLSQDIVKYDAKMNTATIVAQLPTGMYGMSCAMVNDVVYIFGGVKTGWVHNIEILKFNTKTLMFENTDMQFSNNGNLFSSAVTVGEQIYVIGGVTQDGVFHHVTKFDPIAMTLEHFDVPNHNMLYAGISTAFVEAKNQIYVVGGFTFENNKTKQLKEIFYFQL